MKTSANRRWVAGWVVMLCAGGLFGCDTTPKKEEPASQGGPTDSRLDTMREEETIPDSVALLPGPKFNPKAGRIPLTRAEYEAALQSIKTYREENKKAIVTSNYFSDSLVRALIGREGSATDKKVSGLRVYRTYIPGRKGFGVLISAVDSTGNEIKNPIQLKDGFTGDYLFGTSEEKCPHNCGRLEEQQ